MHRYQNNKGRHTSNGRGNSRYVTDEGIYSTQSQPRDYDHHMHDNAPKQEYSRTDEVTSREHYRYDSWRQEPSSYRSSDRQATHSHATHKRSHRPDDRNRKDQLRDTKSTHSAGDKKWYKAQQSSSEPVWQPSSRYGHRDDHDDRDQVIHHNGRDGSGRFGDVDSFSRQTTTGSWQSKRRKGADVRSHSWKATGHRSSHPTDNDDDRLWKPSEAWETSERQRQGHQDKRRQQDHPRSPKHFKSKHNGGPNNRASHHDFVPRKQYDWRKGGKSQNHDEDYHRGFHRSTSGKQRARSTSPSRSRSPMSTSSHNPSLKGKAPHRYQRSSSRSHSRSRSGSLARSVGSSSSLSRYASRKAYRGRSRSPIDTQRHEIEYGSRKRRRSDSSRSSRSRSPFGARETTHRLPSPHTASDAQWSYQMDSSFHPSPKFQGGYQRVSGRQNGLRVNGLAKLHQKHFVRQSPTTPPRNRSHLIVQEEEDRHAHTKMHESEQLPVQSEAHVSSLSHTPNERRSSIDQPLGLAEEEASHAAPSPVLNRGRWVAITNHPQALDANIGKPIADLHQRSQRASPTLRATAQSRSQQNPELSDATASGAMGADPLELFEPRASVRGEPLVTKETAMIVDESISSSHQGKEELYKIVDQVGEGTYGKVYKARNGVTGCHVALKRIRMEGERDGFPVTAMREIKLLQSLHHPNVITLIEMMVSRGHVYMVFEYMDHDLTGILSQTQFSFSPAHLKSLSRQMLAGLAYLHHKRIIHRDIKGSNILINNRGELKLADFGLARFYQKRRRTDYTNRVITLWYRPPELLLGATVYGPEVDMWSAGCIMLELFTTKPVFQGNDEIHQLEVIYEILGSATVEDWPELADLPWYELVKPKVHARGGLRELFKRWLSPAALSLVGMLLNYNPQKRISAIAAMETGYFIEEEPAEIKPDLSSLEGEWHEFESKRERAKRRRRVE